MKSRFWGNVSLVGVGTGERGTGGAIAPLIFLEGGQSPLHLQPSIVTIQTFEAQLGIHMWPK